MVGPCGQARRGLGLDGALGGPLESLGENICCLCGLGTAMLVGEGRGIAIPCSLPISGWCSDGATRLRRLRGPHAGEMDVQGLRRNHLLGGMMWLSDAPCVTWGRQRTFYTFWGVPGTSGGQECFLWGELALEGGLLGASVWLLLCCLEIPLGSRATF